jgi:hypothetical protein
MAQNYVALFERMLQREPRRFGEAGLSAVRTDHPRIA